jgi:novobiocin biosynthesis protein NovU/D-mycarose 3-C-methyltransferase
VPKNCEEAMKEIIRNVERCRVCGDDDWFEMFSFGAVPLANGFLDPAPSYEGEPTYPADVIVCRRCWLMSLRQVVDPEALFGHYVYVSSNSDQINQHMRRVADWCTQKLGLAPGDLVVEMGSNIGTQLALFKERGMQVTGVDPARNLVQVANDNGIESIAEFFGPEVAGPITRSQGEAKLVLGRQCFAHIDDVHNILKGVDAVLAPDGGLVIEVPYLLDLLNENQFDTIYHEHLSYYSLGTLRILLEAHGLRLVDVERADVHGGSIVIFATRTTNPRQPAAAVAALLDLEEKHGLSTELPYRQFAERTRQVIDSVGSLVRALAGKGERIAAYGAPSKGTHLLIACGLTSKEIEFCIDTTPLKHGKVLPGSHVPVRSPEQGRQTPPDYYLLLAWNYADEIIGKERSFLDGGGRFIVPIPEPRIVSADETTQQA